jgi:hypothetical protein
MAPDVYQLLFAKPKCTVRDLGMLSLGEEEHNAVVGILTQMIEIFEANLAASQKDEMASQKANEELKAAKVAEIAAGQTQLDTKSGELAADHNFLDDTGEMLTHEADDSFVGTLSYEEVYEMEWVEGVIDLAAAMGPLQVPLIVRGTGSASYINGGCSSVMAGWPGVVMHAGPVESLR